MIKTKNQNIPSNDESYLYFLFESVNVTNALLIRLNSSFWLFSEDWFLSGWIWKLLNDNSYLSSENWNYTNL